MKEAALQNAIVLEQFNFNLTQAITAQPFSQVMFGSKFRHPSELEPLLSNHPHWIEFSKLLSRGATFPLRPISPDQRAMNL
jgi:hypothetical protein